MESLMTTFEGFSVSLARTVFFSKQKCKVVNVARGDPKWEKWRALACVSSWEFFLSFSCYYQPLVISTGLINMGRNKSHKHFCSQLLWFVTLLRVCLTTHLAKMAALSQPFQLLSQSIPMKPNGCNYEIFLGNILCTGRTSEGNKF